MRLRTVLVFFSFALLIAMAGMLVGYQTALRRAEPVIVEKIVVDTLSHSNPKPASVKDVQYVTRWLPSIPIPVVLDDFKPASEILAEMNDHTEESDSALVSIPIETKVYFQENEYYAEVRGFEPELTYIEVYPKTITRYVEVPKKRRIAFGPTASVGLGPGGANWMIGVGVTWNILP